MSYVESARSRYILKLRREIVEAYGGCCECCGETAAEFLTLHHTHGNGREHRISLLGHNSGGFVFYAKLRQLDFPRDGLELLCWSCHKAREIYGSCPHEAALSLSTT